MILQKEKKDGLFTKLQKSIYGSSNKISQAIANLTKDNNISQEDLEILEEQLILSDVSARTARKIIEDIEDIAKSNKITSKEEVQEMLAKEIEEIMLPYVKSLDINTKTKPRIILTCGVNGSGKTTTIAKMAYLLKNMGWSVLIAACDTFRAAGVQQLELWAQKINVDIELPQTPNEDASAVAYRACERAKKDNYDVVLIDTAGRLQNKHDLMEELKKIVRVIQKQHSDAPHDRVIIVDATTGNNAISQIQIFREAVNLTGMIVAKMDGASKGGILVSLVENFKIPIHGVGAGESVDDLHYFNAEEFAKSLVGIEE